MSSPTHYELLGIEPGATPADIKSAFRQQALRNHPDQGGNSAVFRMIEDAYETLSDPARRLLYDRQFVGAINDRSSGQHFSQADEPTQTWTREEWERAGWDNSWPGDDATMVDDREPGEETAPTFVRKGRKWPHPRDLHRRLPLYWWRWLIAAAVAYVLVAFAMRFEAIPGVENWSLLQGLLVGLLLYALGPWALRVAGYVFAILAMWRAAENDAAALETAMTLVLAFGLWFVGHWLHTFKTGNTKSVIADSLFNYLPGMTHPAYRFDRRGY